MEEVMGMHVWIPRGLECAARVGYTESSKIFVLQSETQSQKLKKGDKEGEEGRERERYRRKKGAMARVKGMCLTR